MVTYLKRKAVKYATKGLLPSLTECFTRDHSAVLMLHRFYDSSYNSSKDLLITPDFLEKAICYLVQNNYRIISLRKLISSILEGEILYKTVCFSIDDGYSDVMNIAFPVFKKYDVPVTVFITTEFVSGNVMMWWDKVHYIINNSMKHLIVYATQFSSENLMIDTTLHKIHSYDYIVRHLKTLPLQEILTKIDELSSETEVPLPNRLPPQYAAISWDDVWEMQQHGFDFEAHTVNHPILSRLPFEQQEYEIAESATEIEHRTGIRPILFCYPNGKLGDFNEHSISILKREGFIASFTGAYGFVGASDEVHQPKDFFRLRRLAFPLIYEDFVQRVSGMEYLKTKLRDRFR